MSEQSTVTEKAESEIVTTDTDAIAASSTADANSQASSADNGAKPPSSIAEVVSAALKADEQQAPAEEGKQEAPPTTSSEEEPGKPDADATATDPGKSNDGQDAEPSDVPFHKHPRWQEMRAKVKELEPQAKLVQELKSYTGGDEGFQTMRNLAFSYAHDPAKAVPILEKMIEDARKRGGLIIHSADLRKKVDEGVIDEQSALEVEQARLGKQTQEQQAQAAEQQRADKSRQEIITTLNSWEDNVRKRDPDYASIQTRVQRELVAMVAERGRPESPQAAVAMAQEAYDAIKGWAGQMIPKPKPVNTLKSGGSGVQAKPAPKTMREAISQSLRKG